MCTDPLDPVEPACVDAMWIPPLSLCFPAPLFNVTDPPVDSVEYPAETSMADPTPSTVAPLAMYIEPAPPSNESPLLTIILPLESLPFPVVTSIEPLAF